MGTGSYATTGPQYVNSSTFSSYSIDVEPVSGGVRGSSSVQPISPIGGGNQIEPFPISPGDGDVSPMPEPSTWVAAALSLGAVIYSQRRRLIRLIRSA
jgi:hypothetical protein